MFIITQDKNWSIDSYLIRTMEIKYYSNDDMYYIIAEIETNKRLDLSNRIGLGKYPTEQEAKNELINLSRVLSAKDCQDNLYIMG